jgi:hypothetical protein
MNHNIAYVAQESTKHNMSSALTYFVALSSPTGKQGKPLKKSIVSMVCTESDNLTIELLKSSEFFSRMVVMHYTKICVIYVSNKFHSLINPYVIDKRLVQGADRIRIKFMIIPILYSTFFNPSSGINKKFLYDNMKAGAKDFDGDFIYIFEGDEESNWTTITAAFAGVGVDIIGGSNPKRHLLSPNHHRLSQFLYCLYGKRATTIISESFHRKEGIEKLLDWQTKDAENQIKEYRDSFEKKSGKDEGTVTLWDHDDSKTNRINFKNPELNELIESNNIKSKSKLVSVLFDYYGKAEGGEENGNDLNSEIPDILFSSFSHSEPSGSNNYQNQILDKKANVAERCSKRKIHTSAIKMNGSINRKEVPDLIESPQPVSTIDSISSDKLTGASNPLVTLKNISSSNKKNSITSCYLNIIDKIISEIDNEDETKRHEVQRRFENYWIELIEEKLKDEQFLINRHQNKLFYVIKQARDTLNIMSEQNYLKKKFPKLHLNLNEIDYLILTFSLCVTLYSRLSYNSLVLRVGEEIIYLIYKKEILNKNKKFTSSPENTGFLLSEDVESTSFTGPSYNDYKNSLEIENVDIIKIGDFFISIFQQFPHDIFNRKILDNSFYTHEPYTLEINKEYLEDLKSNLIINPNTLPMLCLPNKWSESEYGGYLINKDRGVDIITSIDKVKHKVENKDSIYRAVNFLNSIKFCVNTDLLNYLLSPEGAYILDNVRADDELQRQLTLKIATFYRDNYFYLNTHADWRGRIYTQSFYISYQGGDLSSALVNFFEGEPITSNGKLYLYIYGANSHDENKISKASFTDRLKWVKQNYEKIINLDRNLILSAENPFIFTTFCLNMKKLHQNPSAIIKTPVFLDATCSGIQHLAALIKNLELGSQTNLLPSTIDDIPEDLYSSLLEPINKAIRDYGQNSMEFEILKYVKLTRKEIKRTIMTKVYNVTIYGISNQLKETFKSIFNNETVGKGGGADVNGIEREFENKSLKEVEKALQISLAKKTKTVNYKYICKGIDGKSVTLLNKDIYKMAEIINEQIFIVYPALSEIYNYFIDIAKLTIKLGISLTWLTPSGLKITQFYPKQRTKIVSVSIFGKPKKLVFKENDNKLDGRSQTQAIIPNIIHSLDASHLINIINTASNNKLTPVVTIHDCFGTLPNKMSELDILVKKEFILLYSDSKFLKSFHQRFIQNINDNNFEIKTENKETYVYLDNLTKIKIPSIPKLGKLDIKKIINSRYMIS